MNLITKTAHAKINLGLEVLYKRDDGFHEINTVFSRLCLADELTFEEHTELIVICNPDLNIAPEDNLVYKTAQFIKHKYNIKKGARITINKKIPMGGGLGGGSSDAAAAILGLNQLWQLNLDYSSLHSIAAHIGSDVPYFLKPGAATGRGRGELLEYFEYQLPAYLLLVNPFIHISTPQAYKSLNRTNKKIPPSDLKAILTQNPVENYKNLLFNDFETPVFENHPELLAIKEKLYSSNAQYVSLSGSGSTIYALFVNKNDGLKAKHLFPDYFTHICDH